MKDVAATIFVVLYSRSASAFVHDGFSSERKTELSLLRLGACDECSVDKLIFKLKWCRLLELGALQQRDF